MNPELPKLGQKRWARNDIDRFILARLEEREISPSVEASRATLIRRASLDLLGLPPTPEEIEHFVDDPDPHAYNRLIDRLLASPHYGERWGRHWLDVAGFGESQGYERDQIRDNAWRYRDYVIGAFNSDMSYPQFIREQLAGDILDEVTRDSIIATGFLVGAPWDQSGHQQQSEIGRQRVRANELEGVVGLIGQTFLGLTVNCARCHDHKFDPILQKDYYRLQAVFQGVWHGDRSVLTPSEQKVRKARIGIIEEKIQGAVDQLAELEGPVRRRVMAKRGRVIDTAVPQPRSRWTFDIGVKDSLGGQHARLYDGAEVSEGRARFSKADSQIRTGPLLSDIGERTYEAWVTLTKLGTFAQIIALSSPAKLGSHDALMYSGNVSDDNQDGELRGSWKNASDYLFRTQSRWQPYKEVAEVGELIQIVAVFRPDHVIEMYRNGVPFGEPYLPEVEGSAGNLQTFNAGDAFVAFGPGDAEIEEVRLYDRALTAEEIAASYRAGADSIVRKDLLAEMSEVQRERWKTLIAELNQHENELESLPEEPMVYAANSRDPGRAYVLSRGDPAHRLEEILPGGLSAIEAVDGRLGTSDMSDGERRLRFAEWVTHASNPLTARVMANRIWHYHFGRGIVGTPNDFGRNGEPPTHPDLLDLLATQFTKGGRSFKKLHRLIMTSATYRQSSNWRKGAAEVDVENTFLWRYQPRRLEAEVIRDSMLAVSGELNFDAGGPGFRPFDLHISNSHFYDLKDIDTPEYNKRTVYRIAVHSARDALMEAFDCPDPSTKTPHRPVTTTPLQSLGLMNGKFPQRQAARFAARLNEFDDINQQVKQAYLQALGRSPGPKEVDAALTHVDAYGLVSFCWVLLNSSEFIYIN